MSAVAAKKADSAPKTNYGTAIKEALREEMESNPNMICLGEDIGILGGAFQITDGLQAEFGTDRVVDMPISEAAIIGTATGAALNGKTVMCELQFIDFISCGFDQIVNMLATYHYRTAGEVHMPVFMRGPAGGYGGGALYHSQMNEAWFAHSPGIKIFCASTPYDAKGLTKAALRDGNPVISYEIKQLYKDDRETAEVLPTEDYIVPFGKAAVRRQGTDLTLCSYGNPMKFCMQAADLLKEKGVNTEVIDLRSLVPLDEETILNSIGKTNRLVVVNEAPMTCGFAGEVIARVCDKGFDLLDAPPVRVTRLDTPVPWVKPLENFVLPQVDDIVQASLRVVNF